MTDTVDPGKKGKTGYAAYIIGGFVFVVLAALTFWLIFKGFKGSGGAVVPGIFTWGNFGIFFILLSLFYSFDGLRLLFVFKTLDADVSFSLMLKLVFINIFASGVTPLATGGGFAQIYFLSKNKVSSGTAAAATTIRTVVASFFIFISVPIILTFEKGIQAVVPVQHGTVYAFLLIMLYVFLLYGLVKKKALLEKVILLIVKFLTTVHLVKPEKHERIKSSVDRELTRFAESLSAFFKGRKRYIFLSLISSIVYLLLLFSFPFVLLKVMNVQLNILVVLSIQVLVTFLIYFTPTPGGSGIAEGGFALVFSHFVSSPYVPPLTFYWRFLTMYLGMLVGFVVFYREVWRKR